MHRLLCPFVPVQMLHMWLCEFSHYLQTREHIAARLSELVAAARGCHQDPKSVFYLMLALSWLSHCGPGAMIRCKWEKEGREICLCWEWEWGLPRSATINSAIKHEASERASAPYGVGRHANSDSGMDAGWSIDNEITFNDIKLIVETWYSFQILCHFLWKLHR